MFACLPTQDGAAAAAELRRAVGELGAVGALINGYTNVGGANTGRYLDDDGYESLVGSAWGFAHETATHAVRLMLPGLFDRHPGVQFILGHLGEGLPALLPRPEHRLSKQKHSVGRADR
jgi:predicted TIM-barrel fold metal-dependent hydrolase